MRCVVVGYFCMRCVFVGNLAESRPHGGHDVPNTRHATRTIESVHFKTPNAMNYKFTI
jgi:hypothetical protein